MPSPTGTEIGVAGVDDFLASHQTFRDVHCDAAHRVLAQMLSDFEHKAIAIVDRLERVENGRQVAVELHVDDGADHLGDAAGGIRDIRHFVTSSFLALRVTTGLG